MESDKLPITIQELINSLDQNSKQAKVLTTVLNTCSSVVNAMNSMPDTSKKRNIFIKSYNRRPQNKKKRRMAIFEVAMSSYIGATQIAITASQPIPKSPNIPASGMAVVGDGGPEIVIDTTGKIINTPLK